MYPCMFRSRSPVRRSPPRRRRSYRSPPRRRRCGVLFSTMKLCQFTKNCSTVEVVREATPPTIRGGDREGTHRFILAILCIYSVNSNTEYSRSRSPVRRRRRSRSPSPKYQARRKSRSRSRSPVSRRRRSRSRSPPSSRRRRQSSRSRSPNNRRGGPPVRRLVS